jgi:hypothetical protein
MSRHLTKVMLALAAACVIVSLAGCAGQPNRSDHAAAATSLSYSASSAAGASAPESTPDSRLPVSPTLVGSYLVDLTRLSGQRGWALAAAPCPSGMCPRVAATRDGGRSWTALSAPSGLNRNSQISQIRFATAKVGYLFGPALYQTRDGGYSWQRVHSRPVEALQPVFGTVLRIVYDHGGCPGPCNRTLQEAAAGSGTWHTLLRIPFARANGDIIAQIITRGTRVIYVPVYGNLAGGQGGIKAVIFRSTDAGRGWQRWPTRAPATERIRTRPPQCRPGPAVTSQSCAIRSPVPAVRSSARPRTMAPAGAHLGRCRQSCNYLRRPGRGG